MEFSEVTEEVTSEDVGAELCVAEVVEDVCELSALVVEEMSPLFVPDEVLLLVSEAVLSVEDVLLVEGAVG